MTETKIEHDRNNVVEHDRNDSETCALIRSPHPKTFTLPPKNVHICINNGICTAVRQANKAFSFIKEFITNKSVFSLYLARIFSSMIAGRGRRYEFNVNMWPGEKWNRINS